MPLTLELLLLFAKGFGIGLIIAVPVGPVAVLCIHRTLHHGALSGFTSGLGAAFGDALYGVIAAFGLTLISDWLLGHQDLVRGIGCVVLFFIGVKMLRAAPAQVPIAERRPHHETLAHSFGSTFLLTVTNPITILAFFAIFAAFGAEDVTRHPMLATALVGGVFAGSTFWWVALAAGAALLRGRMTAGTMVWIGRISGVVILGFAVWLLWGLLGHALLDFGKSR